jgi:Ras-related protein Rab-32
MAVLRYKNEDLKLAFWDIAGQERFTNLTRSYYQGATGGFVVLDITHMKSFEGARRWKADIDAKVMLRDGVPIPVVLLANKSDKLKEGVEPAMDLEQFAKDNGFAGWLATSSFTNTNVKQAVTLLVGKMLELLPGPDPLEQPPEHASIRLGKQEPDPGSTTCCK